MIISCSTRTLSICTSAILHTSSKVSVSGYIMTDEEEIWRLIPVCWVGGTGGVMGHGAAALIESPGDKAPGFKAALYS